MARRMKGTCSLCWPGREGPSKEQNYHSYNRSSLWASVWPKTEAFGFHKCPLNFPLNTAQYFFKCQECWGSAPPGQLFLLAVICFSNYRNLTHSPRPGSKLLYEAFSPFVYLLPNVEMIHILGVNEVSLINGFESWFLPKIFHWPPNCPGTFNNLPTPISVLPILISAHVPSYQGQGAKASTEASSPLYCHWATQQSEEKAEHYTFCNVLNPFNKPVDTRRKSSTDVGQTEIKEGHEKRKAFKCWKSYHLSVSRRCAKWEFTRFVPTWQ